MSQQILRVPEINPKTDDLNLIYKQQLSQIYAINEKKNAKKGSSSSSSSNCVVQKLLPIAVFLIAFSTVMTLLIIYVETFYLKYHEFKVNMTRDFVMNISQDDPQLIEYIRQIHIVPARRFLEHKNRLSKRLHKTSHNEHNRATNSLKPSAKLKFILALLGTQKNGVFIENNAYHLNGLSDTEWLEKSLSWTGLLIESNPEDFFNLQKHNRFRSQAIQACLSTCAHPKDIMYRERTELRGDTYDSGDVRIQKLVDSNRKYFNSREKCFPLFSLMLASDFLHVDYLSLGYENGAVLDVLKTLPFSKTDSSKFNIKIIDVNYGSKETDDLVLIESFLSEHNFVLVEQFDSSFIFFAQNSSLFITP